VPRGRDDGLDGKGRRRAHDRADIVRIGDLVEHQHHAFLGERLDIRCGQGIGLGQKALMHGVRPKPRVDLARPHHLRRETGVDIFLRQPPRGIFGHEKLADAPLWVGKRHRHGVPAIEDHRAVRICLAFAPGGGTGGRTLVERLAAPAELRLSIAVAHRLKLVSRVPDYGNLGGKSMPTAG
jgi:hypothetical protein